MPAADAPHPPPPPQQPSSRAAAAAIDRRFARRVLIVLLIGAVAAALWQIVDILLLAFGSTLVALGLNALAGLVGRLTGARHSYSVLAAAVFVISVLVAVLWIFGAQISAQLAVVSNRLPQAVEGVMSGNSLGELRELLQGSSLGGLVASVFAWGTTIAGVVAGFVLVMTAGVYIALDPQRYRAGFLALIPRGSTAIAEEALDESGLALRNWFVSQLLAMLIVGLVSMLGLWALGIPGFLALGLIAGLFEFVPIIGPIAGAVPAILIASMEDTTTLISVVALFVAIQQIENNLIMPLLSGRVANMPAAIAIFGTLAMGVLFGPLGLLFGYPLAILANVLIRQLYVREIVGKDAELPSEAEQRAES